LKNIHRLGQHFETHVTNYCFIILHIQTELRYLLKAYAKGKRKAKDKIINAKEIKEA
jgi:hypothetical protein